jgi:predicted transcriptional regulator
MNGSQDPLNEREFELINIIGEELGANQMDLSKNCDFPTCAATLLVRRLVVKGYIRTRQLNKKKIQYILTPKGFAEKYHQSVRYTLKTIRSMGLILHQFDYILWRLYNEGERHFFILGNPDLVELLEMPLKRPHLGGLKFSRVDHVPDHCDGVVLICGQQVDTSLYPGVPCMDVLKEMDSLNKVKL